MNYVGSVSIIDRGDAPAKAIIDKNVRSLAQRVADETKQELDKVMDRVDNIYVSYEMSTQTMFDNPRGSPNVEYIEDIKELEAIITDAVKKKKYQQQVTVFIVGFQDICAQKMQLLQQVNQFFIENSKLDEEELAEEKPSIDLEEASTKVNESLNTAEELTKRLSDINQDMVDYLVNYANTKASNKGKKKLEKSLESARNDVNTLSEKLLTLQAELEEKEDKFQQLVKQLETKSQEAIRYKTAAEVAKKSAQDNENHTSTLQDEILKRDEKIQELRSKLSRLEINLTESQFDTEMSKRRLDNANAQTKLFEIMEEPDCIEEEEEKLAKLQEEVDTKKIATVDAEREMAKVHREQLASLEKSHQEEIEELKQTHMEEIAKLTDELNSVNSMLTRAEKTAQEAFEEADGLRTKIVEIQLNQPDPVEEFRPRSESPSGKSVGELSVEEDQQGIRQESRPSTKDTKSSRKSENKPIIKTTAKSPNRGKEKGKGKEFAETGVQDEGGDPNKASVDKSNDPSRQPTRQSKNLEPVVETGDQEFTDAFELDDEESWSTVPAGHVIGRFAQYRRLSISKMKELGEQLNVTLTKTHRKVNSLKMQFTEHKNKWESERKILIEQVEQAQRLQTDAEKEADAAMTQLEEFINEQEKLEDEEETKRQEIIKTMSRPGTVKRDTSGIADKKTDRRTSVGERGEGTPREERLHSENSDQELKNLMQQTDDAKANTPISRSESGNSQLAPWLNSPEKKIQPSGSDDPSSDPASATSIDSNSRLTSVADAEIRNIVPDEGISKHIEHKKKEENLKPIDGLKGEREKLMSRTSTRLSRQPKRHLSRHIDEREEFPGDESEEGSRLDSQVAPWFAQTDKQPVKRPVTYTTDGTPESQTTVMESSRKESNSVVLSSKKDSDGELEDDIEDELDDFSEVKRSQSVEVVGRRSRPLFSRMQERSKSTALENVGEKEKKAKQNKSKPDIKQVKEKPIQKEKQEKPVEKAPKQDKPIKKGTEQVEKKAVPKGQTQKPKASKQKEIEVPDHSEKRSKTSVGHKPEAYNIRDGAKTAPPKEIDNEHSKDADMNEMMIPLTKDENELISALSSEKLRSASKMSNLIVDLDSRRSMTGTVAKGKMTQMTDVTLPVAMDSDIENEADIDEKEAEEIKHETEIQLLTDVEEVQQVDGTELMTDEDKVRQMSRVTMTTSAKSTKMSRIGFETGRSGALGGLGNHDNQRTPIYTSQSENLPRGRQTVQSTHQQIVSVEVLQHEPDDQNALDEGLTEIVLDLERDIKTDGLIPDDHIQASSLGDIEAQEQKARSQNGAISAPPAVEPDDGEITKTKDSKTPREDEESRPVTPYSRKSTANQSRKILSQQKPETPKEAFRTPRIQSASSISNLSEELFDLDIEKDEGVAMELTPTQTAAMNNLKTMMEEEQFNIEQQKTLDSLRSALCTMSSERPLKDVQLERTVTILSLASQIAKESLELGILPDGVFNGFGGMDSRALSVMSGKEISIKGSALSRRKTVSARPEVIYEPIGDKGEYSKKTEQVVKPDSKTEFKLKADKKKKRRQRSRSRSVSPDRKRSNTPKLFEIQQEKAPAKPSTQSSAITLSGSMDMVYGSSRGDSFSASIPRTLTSSEWRKMMSLDDSSTPEPGETKSKLQKQKTRKDIEKGHKPEKPMKVKDEVTMEPGEKAEKSDLSKEDVGTPRVDGLMTQPSISIVISPKKKSRQVTVEQMLYGDQKDNVDLKSLQPMAKQSVQPSIQPSVQPSIESSVQPNVQLTTFEPNVHPQFVQQSIQVKSVQQNVQPKSVQQSVQLDHEMPTEWYNDIFSYRLDETLKITSLKKTIGPARDTKMQGRKSGNRIINIRFNPTFKSDRKRDKKLVSKCYVDDSIYRQIKPHLNVVSFYDLDTMKVKGHNLPETSMNIDDIMRFEYKVKSSNVSERKCDIENVRRANHPYLDNQLLLWKQINDKIKMFDGKYLNSSQQQICKDETKNENSCRKALQVGENQKRSQPKGYKSKSAPTKSNKTDVTGKLKRYHTSTSEFKLKVCIDGFTREFKRESFTSDRTGISENCPSETVTMATENSDTDLPKEKSPGKAITPERRRSSRTPKPVSAKTKTSHRSSLSPNSFSEPQNSSEGISRQLSFTSNRSLLTAPTPGTNVSDFERPLSKGSFESVENISVSVSDVRIGGNSDKTLPAGSASSDLSLSGGGTNAELSRPLSISSVKPVICASPPLLLCKETQTDFSSPEIEREPIIGETEEEIRISSARSRASLRNQFKSRLDETRHAVEERRTKSPVIAVPPQKSIDDELIDDDDYDEDLELAIPDDLKEDVYLQEDTLDAGTSPPPAPKPSKQSSFVSKQNLSEHPVVHQYLRAYTGVHNFKEALSRIMVDKDQMSASQILAELDMLPFDRESKVIPQIETMTENIYYVLNELSQVINSVLQNDRGPVVSSLMMGMSRDTTQRNIRDKSGYTGDLHPPTRSSERSVSTKAESMISDSKYKELNEQYEKLQNQMSEDAKRYDEQQRHNMVVMMEMQDTINQLQRELSTLGKQGRRVSETASTAVGTQQQQQESAIMFTRLDSERNAKIMKKAVNEEKLDPNKYKEVIVQMDEYVNLPAQRLGHLVRKYVHHCRMKEIEENVQKSKSLNENVFEILDKMEALQNQRAKRWADRMDEMGMERMRLANMLMETLDGIEQESGIFLIKPMYSYRGREPKDRYSTKVTRPLRPQRTLSPLRDSNSAYAPAPTPASNVRPFMRLSQGKGDANMYSQSQEYVQPRSEIQGPIEGDNTILTGSSVNYVGVQPKATWSMTDSQPRMDGGLHGGTMSNTPRILELDINRMMIGQNTISAHIGNQQLSNDRLVNASSNNLRSYMTVNRPTGPGSAGKSERPTSGSRGMERSSSSPASYSPSSKHVRMADIEVPTVIPNTQPLPPIGRSGTPDRPSSSDVYRRSPARIPSGDDIPASPPGSSLRQSPPDEQDVENT